MKLIIDGFNKSVHKKDNQIVIYEKGEIIDSIRVSAVTDITIVGKGYITFDALNLIAKNNIKLIAIDYFGRLTYILESPDERNVRLKKEQYLLSENRKGLKIAQELITSKMKNQKGTLKTLNKKKQLKRVNNSRLKIDEYIKQLSMINLASNNAKMQIMGLEGKASSEYWNSIRYFIPPEIGFEKRTRKSHDLLNSMLNYGYAILASEVTKSILLNGLDPYCGFLHYDMDKRTSLTFDLIEPFRQQIVDKTVIGLINRRQVKIEDMDKRNNSIKLEARKLIVKKIMDKMFSTVKYDDEEMNYSQIIRKQSDMLVNTLLNEEKFKSFHLTW